MDPQEQKMIDALPEKTGRDLQGWLTLLNGFGGEKHGEIVKHLKGEHGVTHGYANLIAHYHRGRGADLGAATDDLVDAQYQGKKSGLRPIYDRILGAVEGFGDDVEVAPKKAYVSLRRAKQFALVQPSTASRLDLGIKLPDADPDGRLEASGSFNAMVSHRVRLEAVDQVDDEVVGWLRQAYDAAG